MPWELPGSPDPRSLMPPPPRKKRLPSDGIRQEDTQNKLKGDEGNNTDDDRQGLPFKKRRNSMPDSRNKAEKNNNISDRGRLKTILRSNPTFQPTFSKRSGTEELIIPKSFDQKISLEERLPKSTLVNLTKMALSRYWALMFGQMLTFQREHTLWLSIWQARCNYLISQ